MLHSAIQQYSQLMCGRELLANYTALPGVIAAVKISGPIVPPFVPLRDTVEHLYKGHRSFVPGRVVVLFSEVTTVVSLWEVGQRLSSSQK